MRARNGRIRAPVGIKRRRESKQAQGFAGAALFGIVGYAFGPLGAMIGAAIGASIREKHNRTEGSNGARECG